MMHRDILAYGIQLLGAFTFPLVESNGIGPNGRFSGVSSHIF